MKKFIMVLCLAISLLFWSNRIYAQADPPADHGASTDQPGGGAPIGGGVFILLGLAAAYGGKKLYNQKKSKMEE